MSLYDIANTIEYTPFALAIAESAYWFPILEVIHVLAIALVVGSIAMLDLRLLGVSRKGQGVMELTAETLPWTWGAFVLAVLSGAMLFSSGATRYIENGPFIWKMGLIALAGINMAIFHFSAYRRVHDWNTLLPTPVGARIAASLSLAFWIVVVFLGRWIGFV